MKRLGLSAVFLSVLACGCRAQSAPEHRLPAGIAMNEDAGRRGVLLLPVRLESGETVQFLLDTGSGGSLIDKSLEPKLGERLGHSPVSMFGKNKQDCGIYATPKLYLGQVPLLMDRRIKSYDFRAARIRGLLGMDCLKHYCVQLDFAARQVRFLDSDYLEVGKLGKGYPILFSTPGRPFIYHTSLIGAVRTNTPVTTREFPPSYALIDTGYAADGRVDPEPGVNKNSTWIHLANCVWDGQTYTDLTVGHGENANLLGLHFLARHLVTLDFPRRMVYLKQTSVGPLESNETPMPAATAVEGQGQHKD